MRRRDDRIVELYLSGLDTLEVAVRVEATRNTVRNVLVKRGIAIRKPIPAAQRDARIKKLYISGLNCAEVGRIVGMKRPMVRYILMQLGVPIRDLRPAPGRDDQIARLYREGMSHTELAAKFGLRPASIYDVLERKNVPARLRGVHVRDKPEEWRQAQRLIAQLAKRYGSSPETAGTQIAKATGFSPVTVRKYLASLGVRLRTGGWRPVVTRAVAKKIKADLQDQRLSFRRIAAKHGMSCGAVGAIAGGRAWSDVPWPPPGFYLSRTHGGWASRRVDVGADVRI